MSSSSSEEEEIQNDEYHMSGSDESYSDPGNYF